MKFILMAGLGMALFTWTIARVGPSALAGQIPALGGVLILALGLAAFRFALQAMGWRLAMPPKDRAGIGRAVLAVIGGEGAGYLTWGPISREPVKAMLVSHEMPTRVSLGAAVTERILYTGAATGLVIAGLVILAVRTNHAAFVTPGLLALITVGILTMRWQRPSVPLEMLRPNATFIMIGLGTLQEVTNVFEAYMVFNLLGAMPTIETAIVFEGLSRLVNSAGAFVPGKLGVSELAGASLADVISLGSVHGLTLALTRRLRSLLWAGAGVLVIVLLASRRPRKNSSAADPAIA